MTLKQYLNKKTFFYSNSLFEKEKIKIFLKFVENNPQYIYIDLNVLNFKFNIAAVNPPSKTSKVLEKKKSKTSKVLEKKKSETLKVIEKKNSKTSKVLKKKNSKISKVIIKNKKLTYKFFFKKIYKNNCFFFNNYTYLLKENINNNSFNPRRGKFFFFKKDVLKKNALKKKTLRRLYPFKMLRVYFYCFKKTKNFKFIFIKKLSYMKKKSFKFLIMFKSILKYMLHFYSFLKKKKLKINLMRSGRFCIQKVQVLPKYLLKKKKSLKIANGRVFKR